MSGGFTTTATYALYLALLACVSYVIAYTCAYVAGILMSYLLNARFVFRRAVSLATAGRFPLVYVAQYVVGVLLLRFLVDVCGLAPRLAPLLIIVVNVPFSYLLSRWSITGSISSGTPPGTPAIS